MYMQFKGCIYLFFLLLFFHSIYVSLVIANQKPSQASQLWQRRDGNMPLHDREVDPKLTSSQSDDGGNRNPATEVSLPFWTCPLWGTSLNKQPLCLEHQLFH